MSEPRDVADERSGSTAPSPDSLIHDDDELASALAAQMLRYAPTGAIKIVPPADPDPSDHNASTSERSSATDLTPTPPRDFAAVSTPAESNSESAPESQPAPELYSAPEAEQVPPVGPAIAPEADGTVTPDSGSSDTVAIDLTELIREEQGTDFSAFAAAAGIPVPPTAPAPEDDASEREGAEQAAASTFEGDDRVTAGDPSPTPGAVEGTEQDAGALTPDSVEGETALEKALLLESALAEVAVDTAMYADWEQSLRSMSEAASESVAHSEQSVPVERPGSESETASAPADGASSETGDSARDEVNPAPGPRRGTYTSPIPTTPAELVAEERSVETETAASPAEDAGAQQPEPEGAVVDDGEPVVSELPQAEAGVGELALVEPGDSAAGRLDSELDDIDDSGPVTSVIDVDTQPAASIPEDEFVAIPVAARESNDAPDVTDAEVVEAEVVDDDHIEQQSASATTSTVASPDESTATVVEDGGSDTESDAEDAARAVPTTTGPVIGLLAATPPRWAGGIDGAPAMARPRVPGSPLESDALAPSDEDDDYPLVPGPRRTPPPAGDETPQSSETDGGAGLTSSEPEFLATPAPGAVSAEAPDPADAPTTPATSNDLITDTGPLTLGQGARGPRIDTGSVPIITGGMQLDVDLDDDVDDVATPFEALLDGGDRAPIAPAEPGDHTGPIIPISTAALVAGPAPATGAVPTTREVSTDTGRLSYALPASVAANAAGPSGFGPHFASWPGAASSVVVLALGALLVSGGLSALQAVLATVVGAVAAALPIALTTLGAARSRTSGAALSRSSFGSTGAAIPNSVLVIARVVVFAGLLWALVIAARSVVFESGYDLFIDPTIAAWIIAGLVVIGAAVLAATGGRALARAQWLVSVVAVISVLSLIVGSAGLVDFPTVSGAAGAQPIAVFAGAMTVLTLIAAVWGGVGADVLSTRAESRSGIGAALGTTLGTILPLTVLVVWGALLAATDPARAALLSTDPVAAMAQNLPAWYPLPLLLAVLAPALAATALVARSGGVLLASVASGVPRFASTIAVVFVGACVGAVLVLLVPASDVLVLSAASLVAVPVLAWSGIVGVEALLRKDDDGLSAFTGGGAVAAFRWGPLSSFVVITALGWGMLIPSTSTGGVGGWVWSALGMAGSAVASSGLGVLVALVLGAVVGIVGALGSSRGRDDRPARTAPSDLLSAPRNAADDVPR